MDIQNKIEQIRTHAREILSEKRFMHCLRTGEYAAAAAPGFGIDPDKAFLAGIAHDICKCMTPREMAVLAEKDALPFSDLERNNNVLLHGRAAAVYIQEKFNIDDPDIIDAIRCHTSGKPQASPLTLLIYAADKVEPGREYETGSFRAIGETKGLHCMALAVARCVTEILVSEKKEPAPETGLMIKWLETYEAAHNI